VQRDETLVRRGAGMEGGALSNEFAQAQEKDLVGSGCLLTSPPAKSGGFFDLISQQITHNA